MNGLGSKRDDRPKLEGGLERSQRWDARARIAEESLQALQLTVAAVVSARDVDTALQAVMEAAPRAPEIRGHVLRLEALGWLDRHLYTVGIDEGEARALAKRVEEAGFVGENVVVQIESNGQQYGHLIAVANGRPIPADALAALTACTQLAASALDAGAALDQAVHDAQTTQALLDLSTSLADTGNVDDVAARIARSVPQLVDCDRAAVVMFDSGTDRGRVAGSYGYPEAAEQFLRSVTFSVPASNRVREPTFHDTTSEDRLVRSLMAGTGSVAGVVVPIAIDQEIAGFVVAGVIDGPERLTATDRSTDVLHGLAAQASTAVRNAQLLGQIRHQALHDSLTDLPNRALILDRVEHMLTRAQRTGAHCGALFIDLDGFKDINDTLGHESGDQILRAVGKRLGAALRGSDTIGRLGGDEFVVLVEGDASGAEPEIVAQRLLDALREPFPLPGHARALTISASIGIAAGQRLTASELLRDADVALYRAKARGKSCFVIFEPAMHVAVRDRLELDMDLHHAFERSEFFVEYQPMFDLRARKLSGAEALLRWRHHDRGLVAPDAFIPLLEDSRLIVDVGKWILEEVCGHAARWHAQGHEIDISVNVSTRQLEEQSFATDVAEIVRCSGINASSLVLEVSETALMRDPDLSSTRLHELKAIGVRLAIDDFGTGYTSLTQLQRFPIDALKIDRSFIAAMGTSAEGGAIIHTLVQFGKLLGVTTLAEGIEDHMQYARLRREQFDGGQGFLLAKPLSLRAFEATLSDPMLNPEPMQSQSSGT